METPRSQLDIPLDWSNPLGVKVLLSLTGEKMGVDLQTEPSPALDGLAMGAKVSPAREKIVPRHLDANVVLENRNGTVGTAVCSVSLRRPDFACSVMWQKFPFLTWQLAIVATS